MTGVCGTGVSAPGIAVGARGAPSPPPAVSGAMGWAGCAWAGGWEGNLSTIELLARDALPE